MLFDDYYKDLGINTCDVTCDAKCHQQWICGFHYIVLLKLLKRTFSLVLALLFLIKII